MNIGDKVKLARYAMALDAAARWDRQADARRAHRQDAAEGGGDTPRRQQAFAQREQTRALARDLSAQGRLPRALERRIGPSLDFGYYAPSEAARAAGRPVARITYMPEKGVVAEPIATGFLVSRRLLMTNQHVTATANEAKGLGANFLFEYGERGLATGRYYELDPDTFFHADARLDFALVALKGASLESEPLDDLGFVPLIEATPKILIGQPVNIIQHPEGRAKTYAVSENRLVDILDDGFLHYETDTLAGSSGSPAFSARWELVALHHCGVPRMVDGVIRTRSGGEWDPENMSDDEVDWVANEGARVSHIVGALQTLRMPTPAQQTLLDELLSGTGDPLRAVEKIAAAEGGPTGGASMAHNVFNFSGPVTIHIHAPGAPPTILADVAPADAAAALAGMTAPEKKQTFDADYAGRKGYDPTFLATPLPPPDVAGGRLAEMLLGDDGRPVVLPYHHFSLVMNATRRMCMWAASNADYNDDARDERPRKAFGGEDWTLDPRVPPALQIVDEEFYGPANNVDRGHIVRRDDNCWGQTRLEREYANADTYHWTNCTPQHEAFNQERPKGEQYKDIRGLWGGLESHLVGQLAGVGRKASQFAGPVLDNAADPKADFGRGAIQYPTRFWKVIAVERAEGGPKPRLYVYGFVLDQSDVIKKFRLNERIELGDFKAFATPLKAIEALAGVTFATVFHDHDAVAAEAPVDGDESLKALLPEAA